MIEKQTVTFEPNQCTEIPLKWFEIYPNEGGFDVTPYINDILDLYNVEITNLRFTFEYILTSGIDQESLITDGKMDESKIKRGLVWFAICSCNEEKIYNSDDQYWNWYYLGE